jgi:cytochrome c peroxidase
MTLVNTAYRDALTWANPTLRTLEVQVLVPLFSAKPVELGLAGHESRVYAALAADPVYKPLLAAAFPDDAAPMTTPHVAAALAAFVRSIVSFRSPFDRYRQNEEMDALSESAKRGMVLFFSNRKARCGNCHRGLNLDGGAKTVDSPPNEGEVFQFHNTAFYNLPTPFTYPADNAGLYETTGMVQDVGKFRIPTLRNIAVTAPYMHDGSIPTLADVLNHYVGGGRTANPNRTTALSPLTLTSDERRDLMAFLESLTDTEALRDPRWSDPWPRSRSDAGAGQVAARP